MTNTMAYGDLMRTNDAARLELEVQRICNSSEELKTLERNLRIAYINKERAAQHQEALLLRALEQEREKAMDGVMEYDRQRKEIEEERLEQERRDKMRNQKDVLISQMQANESMKARAREEALREKELVDSIIDRIDHEERLEQLEHQKKREQTRSMIASYQQERQQQKEALAQKEREQQAEIDAYNDMMRERYRKKEEERKRMEAEKARQYGRVVEETRNQTDTKEELENLRNMLWEEEFEARREKEDKEERLRKEAEREEIMKANIEQIAMRKEVLKKMEEEEQKLVREMFKKFEENEEEEKLDMMQRQEAKRRFVEEARRQREERERLYLEEKDRENNEQKHSIEEEKYRQLVIEEAKKRLLEEHMGRLKGFLPKMEGRTT